MEKLGERNAYMISKAFRSAGADFDYAYAYIEEDLYVDEAEMIGKFMLWIIETGSGYTEHRAEDLFQLFKKQQS